VNRRRVEQLVSRLGPALLAVGILYLLLLLHPQTVFPHQVRAGNVVLHSRSPLPPEASAIAAAAQTRIAASPLYDASRTYPVFLCDAPWLFALFTPWHSRAGGVSHALLGGNAFVRPANVERDRVIGPSGNEVGADRPLSYFVAHEIAHAMIAARVGRLGYLRLRTWQNEGYADYVAKGGSLDLARLRPGDFDPAVSGLYVRYQLEVASMLRRMSADALLSSPREEPGSRE